MNWERATKPNVLLVEDSAADVFLVRAALKKHKIDCNLSVIGDGEEVLRFIARIESDAQLEPLDLVLLDLHLPKRDGAEILAQLRASERSGRTPVVVFTSSDSSSDRQKTEKHGPLYYFVKPISLDGFMELGGIVQNILSNSQQIQTVLSKVQTAGGAA